MTSKAPFRRQPDGSWVDGETGEVITADLPLRLNSVVNAVMFACAGLNGSHAPEINANRQRRAVRMLVPLQQELDEVQARIDHGWAWLDRHPGHAMFTEREEHVLTWIAQYEAMQRAIVAAQGVLA